MPASPLAAYKRCSHPPTLDQHYALQQTGCTQEECDCQRGGTHHIALEQAVPKGARDCKHAANAPGSGPDNNTPRGLNAAALICPVGLVVIRQLHSCTRRGGCTSDSVQASLSAQGFLLSILIFRQHAALW